jgi:integrase
VDDEYLIGDECRQRKTNTPSHDLERCLPRSEDCADHGKAPLGLATKGLRRALRADSSLACRSVEADEAKRRRLFPALPQSSQAVRGAFPRQIKGFGTPCWPQLRELRQQEGSLLQRQTRCSRWSLHIFRRTFASWHHNSEISARTLQAWLGHSSLDTTLRYLKVADLRSERIRSQVDRTFAAVVTMAEPD